MSFTLGDIAGIIAAVAFLLLVIFLAVPLVKMGKAFDSVSDSVDDLTDHTLPILDETAQTVKQTNKQLDRVDSITSSLAKTTQNVAALSDLYSAALGKPVMKAVSTVDGLKTMFTKKKDDLKSKVKGDQAIRKQPSTVKTEVKSEVKKVDAISKNIESSKHANVVDMTEIAKSAAKNVSESAVKEIAKGTKTGKHTK